MKLIFSFNAKILISSFILLVFLTSVFGQADYSWLNPRPQGGTVTCIIKAGNQLVAVGGSGTVLTSPDGDTWTVQKPVIKRHLLSVAWSGSLFLAVGDTGAIITSPDAVTWTKQRDLSARYSFRSVIWADSHFVVVGDGGQIYLTKDGESWQWQNSGIGGRFFTIAQTDSLFVVSGNIGASVITSPDGFTWTNHTTNQAFYLRSIIWAGSILVGVGEHGIIATSPDGITWTMQESVNSMRLFSVAHGNGNFIAVGDSGIILTSTDGRIWTMRDSGSVDNLYSVMWTGNEFIASGHFGTMLTSSDGSQWILKSEGFRYNLNDIVWADSFFVAVSDIGAIITSPDGFNWTRQNVSISDQNLNSITWNGELLVAVGGRVGESHGYNGKVVTSPDGINWSNRAHFPMGQLHDVIWADTQFVAIGDRLTAITSPDGITWTLQTPITYDTPSIFSIAFTGDHYIGVGDEGRYWWSFDGSRGWGRGSQTDYLHIHHSVIWADTQLVMVGRLGLIFTSPEGEWNTWSQKASPTGDFLHSVAFGDGRYVAVGDNGTFVVSYDSEIWTNNYINTYSTLNAVTWTGTHFIAVGDNGTIISYPPFSGGIIEKTITLTAPDGGQELFPDSVFNITWTTTGSFDYVNIEYSTGIEWITIVDSTENDGNYEWTVPDAISNTVTVRVSSLAGDFSDESDEVFEIKQAPVHLHSLSSGRNGYYCLNNTLTITAPDTAPHSIIVFDINGTVVKRVELFRNLVTVSTEGWGRGIYVVRCGGFVKTILITKP